MNYTEYEIEHFYYDMDDANTINMLHFEIALYDGKEYRLDLRLTKGEELSKFKVNDDDLIVKDFIVKYNDGVKAYNRYLSLFELFNFVEIALNAKDHERGALEYLHQVSFDSLVKSFIDTCVKAYSNQIRKAQF